MTLRGNRVSEPTTLPDGRSATITVGIFDDDYIEERSDTVMVELRAADEVLVSLNTVLEPEQTSEARQLAREIRTGLESGTLEPTAAAIEPLARELR